MQLIAILMMDYIVIWITDFNATIKREVSVLMITQEIIMSWVLIVFHKII